MAIAVAGSSSYTPTGTTQDLSGGASVPLPTGMAVGDYVVAAVYIAQMTGVSTTPVVPTGWTILNSGSYGTSANRLLVLYGYKIPNAAALSAIGSTVTIKGNAASTRVVASVHRLTGVDLSATPSLGALEYLASAATTVTFNQPATGATKFFFLGTNNSQPSLPPVITSTGGTVVVTNRSLANSGATADSQLTTFIGGTGAAYSVSTANHVSFGLGFTPLVATFIKTTSGATVYGTSDTTNIPAPALGNGLVVIIQHASTSSIAVSDNAGNTWTRRSASELASPAATGQNKVDIWDCLASAIVTAPTSVTVTTSVTNQIGTTVYEITGVNWQAAAMANNTTSPASGAPSITPAVGDFIITTIGYAAPSQSATAASPYTTVPGLGVAAARFDSAYATAASTAASTPVWTVSGSTGGAGFASSSYGLAASPTGDVAPVAGFSSTTSGLTVTVTSSATDSDGTIASTDYDWGDSTTHGSTANASHTYAAAGTYTIIQTVTDNGGLTNSASHSLTISMPNVAPTASFTHSESGLVTSVNASSSSDSDGSIASYDWNWGDSTTHGSTATTSHTYSAAGSYTVTLTVTDNLGATSSTTATVSPGTTVSAPTRVGYTSLNPGINETTLTVDPSVVTGGAALLTGHWMIATITATTTNTITAPSGWTTLRSISTAGSLRYAVYGKIRLAGESTYSFTMSSGGTTSSLTLMWGAGADTTLSNWVVGSNTNRSVDLHNTGASLTTTVDHSLILGISVERTSVTETGITGVTGATEWFFMPQTTGQLQTVDVAYVADKSPVGATTTIDWTYPNTQSVNGMAMQVALPPAASTVPVTVGYPGVLRVGGTNYNGNLFYWDGSAAHTFTTTPIVIFKPVTVTQFLSAAHSPWFGAHRGFSYSYPEETLYSYRGATDWQIKAIEISVQKSQDGTFWCFHDATTTRTTGTTGTIASMTDAAIGALTNLGSTATANSTQPARPTAKLVDVLNTYAATHVIIIEDKTYANTTAMLNLMDSYGTTSRPANDIFIWKVDATSGASFFTPAAARGYHRWGYIFDASMAGSFATVVASGKADMIGLDFNSSDATLSAAVASCISNGVRPTGHIINSVAQRDRMLGLGMTGLMISNKDVVPPWYNVWPS